MFPGVSLYFCQHLALEYEANVFVIPGHHISAFDHQIAFVSSDSCLKVRHLKYYVHTVQRI